MKLETWRHWNNRSLLESMPRCSCQCVMQCSMPFSARALKKNIFFDVDIVVKNKIEMWFIVVCTLECTFKSESVFSVVKTYIYFIIFDIVIRNKSNVV